MRAVGLAATVAAQRAPRSAKWQKARKAKLRELSKRNPKLAYEAVRLGEIRKEFAEHFAQRELAIVAELRHEGFSLHEIGHTVYMAEQQVTKVIRRWKRVTS